MSVEEVRDKTDRRTAELFQERDGSKIGGVLFENDRFTFGEIQPGKKLLVVPDHASQMIQSVFSIAMGSRTCITCGGRNKIIEEEEHNMVAFGDLGCVKTIAREQGATVYYIAFSKEVLIRMFGEIPAVFKLFRTENSCLDMLAEHNLRVTPEMRSIIDEMITCKRAGLIRKMFLEAKILKLIMLQLEQFEQAERIVEVKLIKAYDVEKIHHARAILEDSISQSVSLIELAHLVGLNDFKLKRGFKEIYHSTVYNYLYELRMEEAKKLLLGTDRSINEIASICGYEFVQSFIKAFKRKFGVSPEKYRNKIKVL